MAQSTPLLQGDPSSSAGFALARWVARPQVAVAVVALLISLSVEFYYGHLARPPQIAAEWNQHLGGEYFNIARALVDGRGFADPFGEATGPTAWMPPLYPLILAALLAITRSRVAVATSVLALTHLSMVVATVTAYTVARRYARAIPPALLLAVHAAWLVAFNIWYFLITQDIWLLTLAISAVVILIYRHLELGETKVWAWAAVGGMIVLSSPALLVAVIAVVAILSTQDRQWRTWGRIVLIIGLLSVPWTVRNGLVFRQFIPVKANLGYDLYLANVVDGDGIYDNATLMSHPLTNSLVRFEYARLGEVQFNEHYQDRARSYLSQHVAAGLRKVANRALAVSFKYHSITDDEVGGALLFARVMYCLPMLSFLVLGMTATRTRRLVDVCCLLAATYLAPYVLLAFYARYWLALSPVFMLAVFLALDSCTAILLRGRKYWLSTRVPE